MSRKPALTETHVNILLLEQAVLASCALLTLFGTLRDVYKVKHTADQVKDFAEGVADGL
jgi:hypothetical protein